MTLMPPTASTAALLADLADLLGAGAVRHRMDGRTDLRIGGGAEPLAHVEPANAREVAAVLALCSARGVPVEPAGAGTWLGAGRPAPGAPLVLSTRRLDAVVEHEPADLVVGVQAGVLLGGLQRHLAAHRQMLPLDPPGWHQSSVGAVLSLGAAGPLRAAHGTPRDVLLGVEVATGDGRLLRFGGRVVKNVAGYDVARLLAGSRGSLGVVTAAFLLLRSLPETDTTVLLHAATGAEAGAVAGRVVAAGVQCEALEMLSPNLSARIRLAATSDQGEVHGWTVAARLRGGRATVEAAAGRVAAVGGAEPARHLDEEASGAFWAALATEEAGASLIARAAHGPASVSETLSATLAALASMSQSDNELGDEHGWRVAVHATAGIVRAWCPAGSAGRLAAQRDSVPAALAALRRDLAGRGGTVHFPVLPDWLHADTDAYQPPPAPTLALMRKIRPVFDPAGIMSPGRHLP